MVGPPHVARRGFAVGLRARVAFTLSAAYGSETVTVCLGEDVTPVRRANGASGCRALATEADSWLMLLNPAMTGLNPLGAARHFTAATHRSGVASVLLR